MQVACAPRAGSAGRAGPSISAEKPVAPSAEASATAIRRTGEACPPAAARAAVSDASLVRSIVGGTSDRAADAAVADFQAGKVAVLILSITAAGVGITLTRGSDALFVETTYVNSEITQAEDRANRLGSKEPLTCFTMIAPGTLDEQIQAVLGGKSDILDQVMVGGDNRAAVLGSDDITNAKPSVIVADLVWQAVDRRAKATKGKGRPKATGGARTAASVKTSRAIQRAAAR